MWQVTYFFLLQALSWLVEHPASAPFDGPLGAVYLGLYQPPTPTILPPTSTLADITEANYAGYARQEVVWYPPYIESSGPYTLEGASLHFRPTDGTAPNTITGVFLADALVGGNLLMSAKWPNQGAGLIDLTTALTVDAVFQFAPTANYGTPELTN